MKIAVFKNGAYVTFEKLAPSGLYLIQGRAPSGEIFDKTRCDDYRDALNYYRAFKAQAKGMR